MHTQTHTSKHTGTYSTHTQSYTTNTHLCDSGGCGGLHADLAVHERGSVTGTVCDEYRYCQERHTHTHTRWRVYPRPTHQLSITKHKSSLFVKTVFFSVIYLCLKLVSMHTTDKNLEAEKEKHCQYPFDLVSSVGYVNVNIASLWSSQFNSFSQLQSQLFWSHLYTAHTHYTVTKTFKN